MTWADFVTRHILGFRGERLKDYFDDLELDKVIPKLLSYIFQRAGAENAIWLMPTEISRLRPNSSSNVFEMDQEVAKHLRQQAVKNITEQDLAARLEGLTGESLLPEICTRDGSSDVLIPLLHPKGDRVLAHIVLLGVPNGKVKSIVRSVSRDLSFMAKHVAFSLQHTEAQRLGFVDDLTGLFNQKYLSMVVESEIGRAQRDSRKMSVLFMDIDYFKAVNDTRGHWVGSRLLVEVGRLLRTNIRRSDYAFRYGGDEFVIVLPFTDSEGAKVTAERLRALVESAEFLIDGERLRLTFSIGLATFPDHAESYKDIIKMADEAMYCGKSKSRNIVYVAS